MVSIRRSDVPEYLRTGSFYANLDQDDDEVFNIPDDCFKMDGRVDSEEDLVSLLHTARYWGLNHGPIEVLQFVLKHSNLNFFHDVKHTFPEYSSYIEKVLQLKASSPALIMVGAIALDLGVPVVQHLQHSGHLLTKEACEAAAYVGDLECLMYLHSQECPWDQQTTALAALSGHIQCLRYALKHHCPVHSELMHYAARTGNIEVLKCLHASGIPWEVSTLRTAIHSKSVDCLRFLHSEGCVIDPLDCGAAAMCDSVACLAFLHQNGGSLDTVFIFAASNGSLACLQYFHAHGGVWNEMCCTFAAQGNHLECLRFAHENGCPWNEDTVKHALVFRSWSCLWYALTRGCPCGNTARVALELIAFTFVAKDALCKHTSDKWYSVAQLYLSLDRVFRSVVKQYTFTHFGSICAHTWVTRCMNCVAVPLSVYFLYANVSALITKYSK